MKNSVGKTCLLNKYIKDQFTMQYKSTIGADFLTKKIVKGPDTLQLQLWDTAGTEKFHSMGSGFYRNSECCILVYDVTDKKSFEAIDTWKSEFLSQLNPPDPDKFPFILIANKSDLTEDRKITMEEGQEFASLNGEMPFYECSALKGNGLKEAFEKAAELAHQRVAINDDVDLPSDSRVKIDDIKSNTKKKCFCANMVN